MMSHCGLIIFHNGNSFVKDGKACTMDVLKNQKGYCR